MRRQYVVLVLVCVCICISVSPVLAGTAIPHGTARADGDSFTRAVGGTNPNKEYTFLNRMAGYYDLDLENAGVGGSKALDVLERIYDEVPVPTPYDTHVINVGYIDMRNRWTDVGVGNATAHRISAMAAYLRAGTVLKGTDTGIQYGGEWYRTAPVHDNYSRVANMTYRAGSTVTVHTTGDLVAFGLLYHNRYPASFNITVDGVTRYVRESREYQCPANDTYCAMAVELPVSKGDHVVRLTNLGGKLSVDWVGYGSREETPVIVINGYTTRSDATDQAAGAVDTANLILQEDLAMFDERVIYCSQENFDQNLNVAIGPGPDVVHPNNFGHFLLFRNMRDAI